MEVKIQTDEEGAEERKMNMRRKKSRKTDSHRKRQTKRVEEKSTGK